jgi:hypothetical protein
MIQARHSSSVQAAGVSERLGASSGGEDGQRASTSGVLNRTSPHSGRRSSGPVSCIGSAGFTLAQPRRSSTCDGFQKNSLAIAVCIGARDWSHHRPTRPEAAMRPARSASNRASCAASKRTWPRARDVRSARSWARSFRRGTQCPRSRRCRKSRWRNWAGPVRRQVATPIPCPLLPFCGWIARIDDGDGAERMLRAARFHRQQQIVRRRASPGGKAPVAVRYGRVVERFTRSDPGQHLACRHGGAPRCVFRRPEHLGDRGAAGQRRGVIGGREVARSAMVALSLPRRAPLAAGVAIPNPQPRCVRSDCSRTLALSSVTYQVDRQPRHPERTTWPPRRPCL